MKSEPGPLNDQQFDPGSLPFFCETVSGEQVLSSLSVAAHSAAKIQYLPRSLSSFLKVADLFVDSCTLSSEPIIKALQITRHQFSQG